MSAKLSSSKSEAQFESDCAKYNRKYAVQFMANEIARQHSDWTLLECVQEAERLYGRGVRPQVVQ